MYNEPLSTRLSSFVSVMVVTSSLPINSEASCHLALMLLQFHVPSQRLDGFPEPLLILVASLVGVGVLRGT